MATDTNQIQSVVRAFDIITCISKEKSIGVSELSRKLGLHKSTIHGLLKTLESIGIISQDSANSNYRLTLGLYKLGSPVLHDLDISKIAHPYLEELVRIHEETAHLVLPDDYEVTYVDKVESPHSIRIGSQVGKSLPYYCTGVGKAILAFQPQEKIDQVLSYTRLVSFTPNTITNYNDLLAELENIRKKGYATDNEEIELGLCCVAAPIRNIQGEVVAAMSISGPAHRMNQKRIDEITGDVLRMSNDISHRLGFNGSSK